MSLLGSAQDEGAQTKISEHLERIEVDLALMRSIDDHFVVPVPETTSAKGFASFVGGKCLRVGRGNAWKDIKAWILELPTKVDTVHLPSVSESSLAWTTSGEVDFQEREGKRPWVTHRIRRGSFFLTSGGAPYDVRWKSVSAKPFASMAVFIELPLLNSAMEEVFGKNAHRARLKDLSAFTDATLNDLMELLQGELMSKKASPLLVQGIAQMLAVHLARNYAEIPQESPSGSPALPGFKLRQITDWMAEHLTEEFNLDRLASQSGLSKFYFSRLFKRATGVSPSQYQVSLRMDHSQRLLRETRKSIVDVGMDMGYSNPSHFARVFRKAVGLSPSDYRQQR